MADVLQVIGAAFALAANEHFGANAIRAALGQQELADTIATEYM